MISFAPPRAIIASAGGEASDFTTPTRPRPVPAPPPVALARPAEIKPKAPKTRTYVVRRGDTLASIARRSGCATVRDIAAMNGLRAPHYAIKPGQTLKLPGC